MRRPAMSACGVVVAIVLGAALAGVTTVGVVKAVETHSKNTQVTEPLISYGTR
jgi:hypothetical protein